MIINQYLIESWLATLKDNLEYGFDEESVRFIIEQMEREIKANEEKQSS